MADGLSHAVSALSMVEAGKHDVEITDPEMDILHVALSLYITSRESGPLSGRPEIVAKVGTAKHLKVKLSEVFNDQ